MGANEIRKITKRYRALCELVPLQPVTTKAGYESAVGHLNRLLDAGGANQANALAGLVEALGEMIHAYESEIFRFSIDRWLKNPCRSANGAARPGQCG